MNAWKGLRILKSALYSMCRTVDGYIIGCYGQFPLRGNKDFHMNSLAKHEELICMKCGGQDSEPHDLPPSAVKTSQVVVYLGVHVKAHMPCGAPTMT
jgi:hypothetical protein